MPLPWNARRTIAIVALALAAVALAQAPAYERPELGFRLVPPAGWEASEDVSPDGMLLLQYTVPSGQGAVGLVAAPILEVDRAFWTGPRDALVQDVWAGFLPEVPGAQITQSYEVVVDGAPASVIDYASPNVAGSIVIVVGDIAGFTFFSVGDRETLQTAQEGLEALVAGFSFLRAGGPASGMGGLGVTPPPNAAGTTDPRNPLDGMPAGPRNPLGGAPAGLVGDPHVGVFADERLRLTLEPASDGLTGEIVFDGERFPVTARPAGGGVGGHFVAGGTAYAFAATLAGDTLTLVTDDARYVLQRVR
jgi:hypothetical protein